MATKMSDKVKGELITRIMVEMKSAALSQNHDSSNQFTLLESWLK